MKNITLLLLLGFIGFSSHAIDKDSDVDEIVWFGLDFSQVKLIGTSENFSDLEKIRNYYFGAWNELFIIEKEKYNLKKAFGIKTVIYDLEQAITRSQQISLDGLLQRNPYSFEVDRAIEVAKEYIDPSSDKVGGIFIVETLNGRDLEGTMWLILFDVSTGGLQYMGKFTGTPGGFGFRNYWIRPFYDVLTQLKGYKQKPI